MNRTGLIVIKVIATIIIAALMTLTKELGVPLIIPNIIGLAVVYAVWKYKPTTDSDSDKRELDKK